MNIGIDFDGVLFDTERYLKFYADYYSYFELNGKLRKSENKVEQENCFDWTVDEFIKFYETYYIIATKIAPIMPGALEIITNLQKQGHKIFLITARNKYHLELALERINETNLKFDEIVYAKNIQEGEYYPKINKFEECKKLNIDVMIEDNPKNIKPFLGSNIKVLFYKDVKISNITGKNIKKINTWFDVYFEVQKMMKNS